MAKPQTKAADAIDVIAGMEDIVSDAETFVRLVDYLVVDALSQQEHGYFRVPRHLADLILFASGKAVEAIKACDERLSDLDPRPSKPGAAT